MKFIKNISILFLASLFWVSCTEDDALTAADAPIPTNVSADVRVTQDNSGKVTITPLGEGVTHFSVNFGDGSNLVTDISPGESLENIYKEGTYEITIIGIGLNGDEVKVTQQVVVTFQAPTNLMVTIENDPTISKQVNVTVNADFAVSYTVDFGVSGVDPISANIGETVSYQYADTGIYTITVEVFGAAIETTTYTEDFEVTAILQPLNSAPTPPFRQDEDVISFFSAAYTNETGSDFFPDWGQGGCCGSSWTMFDLNGDEMLQYTNLSYQGNQFGQGYDVSGMEYVHFDFWTADVLQSVEVSLISLSNGERPYNVTLNQNGWTSVDIPISAFTDQSGFTVTDIHQIKYVGNPFGSTAQDGGTLFVDNIYFWKTASQAPSLAGTWQISPVAGSLRVGPTAGAGDWWSIDDAGVTQRACFYDDKYVFNTDGSFSNVLGTETWVEVWQGIAADACATPVAPHDGSASATFSYDAAGETVTISGAGAYLGIPKAVNAGELPNVAVPNDRTYNVTFNDNDNITVIIESGSGVFWTFEMVRTAGPTSPLDGSWSISPVAGSLRVGPSAGSGDWWSIDAAGVTQRACFYDDEYVFSNGTFTNVLGAETWVEVWQGAAADGCATPVSPHDGSTVATFIYDDVSGTVTIDGMGAYLGIPKAVNAGELPNVSVPASITYDVTLTDPNNMTVIIEAGTGVFWTFELTKN